MLNTHVYRVLAVEVTNHFDLPQVQQLWQERSPDWVRLCHLLGEAILQVCHHDYDDDDDDGCDECDAGNDGGDSDYGDHDDGDHGDHEYYETWSTWVTQTIRHSEDNCVLFLSLTTRTP